MVLCGRNGEVGNLVKTDSASASEEDWEEWEDESNDEVEELDDESNAEDAFPLRKPSASLQRPKKRAVVSGCESQSTCARVSKAPFVTPKSTSKASFESPSTQTLPPRWAKILRTKRMVWTACGARVGEKATRIFCLQIVQRYNLVVHKHP